MGGAELRVQRKQGWKEEAADAKRKKGEMKLAAKRSGGSNH